MISNATAKVIVLGNSSVGKTSVILRFVKNSFDEENQPTVGASYVKREVKVNGKSIELHVWDTAGQERFRSIIPMYMRGSSAVLFVCSTDSPESVDELDSWKEILEKNQPDVKNIFVVLNKSDFRAPELITKASNYAKENGYIFFLTSAKTGEGIENLFQSVAEEILLSSDYNTMHTSRDNIKHLNKEEKEEKTSGCC